MARMMRDGDSNIRWESVAGEIVGVKRRGQHTPPSEEQKLLIFLVMASSQVEPSGPSRFPNPGIVRSNRAEALTRAVRLGEKHIKMTRPEQR